jgi:threonine/homoserine/homoserine lactone efflux protein
MINYTIQRVAYGFDAGLQPGPFQAYLVSQALELPMRRYLPLAVAPLISDGPILILVLLILSQVPPWFLQILEIAGGFFVWKQADTVAADIERFCSGRVRTLPHHSGHLS